MPNFHKQGFTLPELLIVVTIIALLLIAALVNFRRQIDRSYDARRKSDLAKIRRAFEEYYNDHNCYPSLSVLAICGGAGLQPYLPAIPCDPVTKLPYKYVAIDDNNLCKGFRILTTLYDTGDADIAKLGCNGITGCGWGAGYNWGLSSGGPLAASGFNPGATPTPGPTGVPTAPGQYACDPSGICNTYADPRGSGCPISFSDPLCSNLCGNPANRCLR